MSVNEKYILPISDLPLLSEGIKGMFEAGRDLLLLFREAKARPHVINDAIISRARQVYGDQKDEMKKYWATLRSWRGQALRDAEKKALDIFEAGLENINKMHDDIFSQIDFFQSRTI